MRGIFRKLVYEAYPESKCTGAFTVRGILLLTCWLYCRDSSSPQRERLKVSMLGTVDAKIQFVKNVSRIS
ncbi:hypothetical protein J6590_019413 [Homalodisca vitripennis]|nr:hypothetical protein J6590_019413 [Homalodisca vitripennis]